MPGRLLEKHNILTDPGTTATTTPAAAALCFLVRVPLPPFPLFFRFLIGGGGVGLEDHAGDAAVDGGLGAGEDGFLVLASGFAGVDVDIKEGGEEDLTGAVDEGGV